MARVGFKKILYFVAVILCVNFSCVGSPSFVKDSGQTQSKDIRLDVSGYYYNPPELEFAKDSSGMLLAWWLPDDERANIVKILKGKCLVIDRRGGIVDATFEHGRYLKEGYLKRFPQLAYRQKWLYFFKGTGEWFIRQDWHLGIRSNGKYSSRNSFELWNMDDVPVLLTTINLPVSFSYVVAVDFFSKNHEDYVLFACNTETLIVSARDGLVTDRFCYHSDNENSCDYCWGGSIVLQHKNRWLAVGDRKSRRILIVSIDLPHNLITELNPRDTRDSTDFVSELKTGGDEKYLIIKYKNSVEIYDTDSWELCWKDNRNLRSVTISPDGEKIAYVNENYLEVQDFHLMKIQAAIKSYEAPQW